MRPEAAMIQWGRRSHNSDRHDAIYMHTTTMLTTPANVLMMKKMLVAIVASEDRQSPSDRCWLFWLFDR